MNRDGTLCAKHRGQWHRWLDARFGGNTAALVAQQTDMIRQACIRGDGCSGVDTPRLWRVQAMHDGGTVAYSVTIDGRWVGWVGDGAPWRGHRYGGRRWWACWRQDGDTAARWSSELEYPTRKRALSALLARVGGDDT